MTPALGTQVQATLWQVEYRHLSAKAEKPEEQRARVTPPENSIVAMLAANAALERANPWVHGRAFVLTADPSGADLLAVARSAVLGAGEPTHDFSLISVQRVADSVKGLALVEGRRS